MCYNNNIGTINEKKVDIVQLAQEFGLACIQRGDIYYIIGENDIIEWDNEPKSLNWILEQNQI